MFMKLELHAVITWVKKAKAWYLIQCRLMMHSSALQPWKGQLTGIGYSTAVQASGAHCSQRTLDPQLCSQTYYAPVSHARPSPRNPRNYMDHYSFTDPWGMDGWVGHVGWPIADGLTTKWSPIHLAVWCRIGKDQHTNHYATPPI